MRAIQTFLIFCIPVPVAFSSPAAVNILKPPINKMTKATTEANHKT